MINYKYSFTDALNNSSSTSTINPITGHHKRSNSIHLQHSPQQKQDCIFERKLSQESSRTTLSDPSTSTTTTTTTVITSSTVPIPHHHNHHHSSSSSNRFQPRLSEPIIDLNKITEEYNNCQRRLSIASIKRANDSMINWCQFLQEDEDTRFYSQELNQDGLNSSSSLTNLPISSEILLDTFNEHNHNQDNDEQEQEEKSKDKRNSINSSDDEGFKKHNNIQLIRTLSRLTRKNSFSMIKSSRKSTTSA